MTRLAKTTTVTSLWSHPEQPVNLEIDFVSTDGGPYLVSSFTTRQKYETVKRLWWTKKVEIPEPNFSEWEAPNAETQEEFQALGWKMIEEISTGTRQYPYSDAPQTIYETVDSIKTVIPNINPDEAVKIAAVVKAHVHAEKYHVHRDYKRHFDHMLSFERWRKASWKNRLLWRLGVVPKEHITAPIEMMKVWNAGKVKTHSAEEWQNVDRNLAWAGKFVRNHVNRPKDSK
jgi:hypothetical protein